MTGQAGRRYVTGDEVFGSRNEKNAPSKHDSTTGGLSLAWWTRGHRKVQARHEERTSYYEVATMLIDGHTTRSRMTRAYEVLARFLTSFSEFLVAYPRRPDYLALP